MCSDGPLTIPCPWPSIEKADGPSGVRRAKWWVLQQALELGADRLIYCEDDITLAADAIRKVRALDVDDKHAFATFYDYKDLPHASRMPRGLHSVPIMGMDRRGMWGSLLMLIPRRTIEWLCQRGPFDWGDPWPNNPNGGDCTMVWALRDSPWTWRLIHVPSLANHIGDESAADPARNYTIVPPGHQQKARRSAAYFTGE